MRPPERCLRGDCHDDGDLGAHAVFESGNRVLDTSAPPSMPPPACIADDPAAVKDGRTKFRYATVTTVRDDASVAPAERLDRCCPMVDHVIAIPRSAGRDRDDMEVETTNQDLCVARPAVVLRLRGAKMVAGGDQGAIDDPRPPSIPDHRAVE